MDTGVHLHSLGLVVRVPKGYGGCKFLGLKPVQRQRRKQINWELREAHIIGKGNKPRKVYFTDEALTWLRAYLSCRLDEHPALFVIQSDQPKRLEAHGTWRRFRRYATRAGLGKRVYPH